PAGAARPDPARRRQGRLSQAVGGPLTAVSLNGYGDVCRPTLARVGQIDRSHLGPIGFGVVRPKSASFSSGLNLINSAPATKAMGLLVDRRRLGGNADDMDHPPARHAGRAARPGSRVAIRALPAGVATEPVRAPVPDIGSPAVTPPR